MNKENNINSTDHAIALMYLHNDSSKNECTPNPVLITEAEAIIIARYYLCEICDIAISTGCSQRSNWESFMHTYAHDRLRVLVESGHITEKYIRGWWQNRLILMDDLNDSDSCNEALYEVHEAISDSDEELPF